MSAKVKLISFISAFILVLGIMIIGVLSAEQVQVNIGGSVSFNATNVYAKVSGNISGAETGNKTFSTLTYSASETTGDESDWTNLALEFTETPDPIEITITVENLSTQRELQVSLENDIQASGGLNISITKDSQPYTAGQTAMLAKSTGDGSNTTTFVMSLTVANPNEDLTEANFNYILNMTDESAIKEITAQSADSSMGSVTGSGTFVIGEQVTLTATPGQDYLFTEWRANSADGEAVSTSSTYTFTLTSTSPTTYYAVFEQAQLGTLTYTYSDTEAVKTATVVGCTSGANVVVIPETTIYNGETYTVTGIAGGTSSSSSPFYSTRSTLKSITIPSTIETIGNNAFNNCRALTEINYNATNVSDLSSSNRVFYNAGQDGEGITVNIGANVTRLPNYIFYPFSTFGAPNITAVNFAEGSKCESIGDYAFSYCSSLETVSFGENSRLTSIGSSAFERCSSLTSITIGEGVTSIGTSAFRGCYALAEIYNYSTSFTVPQGTYDSRVGELGQYAKVVYNASQLTGDKPATRITVVDNVQYYEYGDDFIALAPTSRNVTEVILDNRTTEINQRAFYSCDSLTSITIPSSVTSIGESAFEDCNSLEYNTDESGVNYLGNDTNEYHALVDDGTLSATSYTIQSTCKVIADSAFLRNTSLENVIIPSSVTSIGTNAFYGCSSLTSVNFGNNSQLTSIGSHAFENCSSLTSITIPENVTNIGDYAFANCSSLISITIGDSVTSIGTWAFRDCTALTEINYNATNAADLTSGNEVFLYAGRDGDGITVNIGANVTRLPNYIFGGGSPNIITVNFAEGSVCESIGDSAFGGCDSLTLINNIPDSVTSIGERAFNGCSSLTSITIPESVTNIDEFAFLGCSNLNNVTIESDDIYLALTSLVACGELISRVNSTGNTVKVLKSMVDIVETDITANPVNTYLNNSSRFTRSVSEDGRYYVYTHI